MNTRLRLGALALLTCALAACEKDSPVTPQPVPTPGPSFVSVSVKRDGGSACALTTEGVAYCWGGYNYTGRLGTGAVDSLSATMRVYTTPVRVVGATRFREIAIDGETTCATALSGDLYCWGRRGVFAPDTSSSGTPVRVPGLRVSGIEMPGWSYGVCGVGTAGEALCDIARGKPQILNAAPGRVFTSYSRQLYYFGVGSPSRGGYSYEYAHQCGITAGRIYCWGDNWYGELGNGTRSNDLDRYPPNPPSATTPPTAIVSDLQFRSVGVGRNFACGLATDDTVWCWGDGSQGKTGTAIERFVMTPTQVQGNLRLRSLSVADTRSCGVTADGTGYCWGVNLPVPTRVPGDIRWKSIAAAGSASCGVSLEGQVYCWGDNSNGALGNGTTESSTAPVRVSTPA